MKIYIILTILLLIATIARAQEIAYVTDSLQLRVYSSPSSDSDVLQTIDSGDSLEVFASQDGFSQVTTYDGTKGWVKSAFLVEEPPAKLLYYSVSEKNKELEVEIEALKNGGINNADNIVSSESNGAQIKELQIALAQQQEANQVLQQHLKERNIAHVEQTTFAVGAHIIELTTNKIWWLLAITTVLLLAGFIVGIKYSAMRMKKRLHGFSL